ncbi:hypothetical protein GCM10010172_28890 [Paractinoplanes ferrugineus]|uniref:Uncharacterized protein n=1 Tax=Paractinoplanes ferrugineus TaxID=113564 RepID=A0A919ISH5_9ACTN|nr:hypothetical protein [Actinoplanes ferrugineus]GIE08201.1 hypothetical protein Afe05nite_00410 [Actinoplanes ferrugineus]
MMRGQEKPTVRQRPNGDHVVGDMDRAERLYAAGTPPMHGFSAKHPISSKVSKIKIGDSLIVLRRDKVWVASNNDGEIGTLRWTPATDGKAHAVTSDIIRLPATGTLHVCQVVQHLGSVKDIMGYVVPTNIEPTG